MSLLKHVLLIIAMVAAGLFVLALLDPNLLDPPRHTGGASAISSVRNIVTAQITYSDTTGEGMYAPDLAALLAEGLIDSVLGSGTKDGYTFRTLAGGEGNTFFTVTATPLNQDKRHPRSFYSDDTGVIRYTSEDRPAWFKDPPLGQ